MRGALLIALVVAAVGCGAGQGAVQATPETDLKITLWPAGWEQGTPSRWTLRCDPNAGTLPKRADACSRLDRMSQPFAPLRDDLACTEVYGGPQQALITGRHEGKRVWVRLAARNGCEIARWNRLRFLVGGASAGAA